VLGPLLRYLLSFVVVSCVCRLLFPSCFFHFLLLCLCQFLQLVFLVPLL
jgi:hypothetical protein